MGRDITEVIARMLAVVPRSEENASFVEALEHVAENARFTAPELMGERWLALGRALHARFGSDYPREPRWAVDCVDIYMGLARGRSR